MSVNLCKAKNRQVKESLVNVLVMVNSLYRIYFFRSIEQFHLFLMMLPGDGKGTLLFPSYRRRLSFPEVTNPTVQGCA